MKRHAVAIVATLAMAARLSALDLYVAAAGSDRNPGTAAAPLATLAKARDQIRDLHEASGLPEGGVTVWIGAGTYDQPEALVFGRQDSGTADRPIAYSAKAGEEVRLTGARALDPSWFTRVDRNSPGWARLDPAARANVYAVDLREHGITNYGILRPGGFHIHSVSSLELVIDGRPMTLARWPNVGEPLARTVSAPSNTRIVYSGERPGRWVGAKDGWLHGLWNTAWADFHVPLASVDTATGTINFTEPPAQFGTGANHPYYAYNMLEELDRPGEYYLDRDEGVLYLWPPGDLAGSVIQATLLEDNLLEVDHAEHLAFRGLILEASRGPLLQISEANAVRVEGCLLRAGGEYAASVTGTDCGLDHCEIVDCGEDGVLLGGGSRASLTPGRNFVSNCRIRRVARTNWTYHPAINFTGGCGNVASHNLIEDLPHAAILFSGNNHRIEYNEIRRVCLLTSDAGAIYSGRDWGYRGNVIRYNFIHHIHSAMEGQGTQGVYLDDCMSSAEVVGNVFYRIDGGAVFCGGGRITSCETTSWPTAGWPTTTATSRAATSPTSREAHGTSSNAWPATASSTRRSPGPRPIPAAPQSRTLGRRSSAATGETRSIASFRTMPAGRTRTGCTRPTSQERGSSRFTPRSKTTIRMKSRSLTSGRAGNAGNGRPSSGVAKGIPAHSFRLHRPPG